MATTVAAAAAILGGVTDTSSLMQVHEGANCDGFLGGGGGDCGDDLAYYSTLIDHNRSCQFDNNAQQLCVSNLSNANHQAANFSGNICH